MNEDRVKPLKWVGSALEDVRSFRRAIRLEIGRALYAAQKGETDPAAKPLLGFGGRSVMEIVASERAGTWRTVYTVRFSEAYLCTPCLPKEIQARDSDTQEGDRSD